MNADWDFATLKPNRLYPRRENEMKEEVKELENR